MCIVVCVHWSWGSSVLSPMQCLGRTAAHTSPSFTADVLVEFSTSMSLSTIRIILGTTLRVEPLRNSVVWDMALRVFNLVVNMFVSNIGGAGLNFLLTVLTVAPRQCRPWMGNGFSHLYKGLGYRPAPSFDPQH